MIKCWRRQAADPQKFKKLLTGGEAIDEIAASTSLLAGNTYAKSYAI